MSNQRSIPNMADTSPQRSAWKRLAVIYIIGLHAFAAALIVKTDFIPKARIKLGLAAPTPDVHLPNMRRVHMWMDASVPDNAVIFLGDSIVQGLATAAIAPNAINYGIGGINAAQLGDLIPDYKSLARARIIVLSVGINDVIFFNGGADLRKQYQRILERLPSATPLVWSAIAPTGLKQVDPKHIRSANQVIAELCAQRGNCTFVDVWPLLAGENGQAMDDMLLDDGIHFSAAGYRIWIAALRDAVAKVPALTQ